MRFMVIVKANKDSEAGMAPDEKLLTDMGNYNEELAKAGVLLAGEGLQPSSKGARVKFSGTKRTVTDGPFAETTGRPRRISPPPWTTTSATTSCASCSRPAIRFSPRRRASRSPSASSGA